MTPVQKWTLKLTEARGKLGDALDAAEPDTEAIQALTREVRHADEALTAATLLEPEPTGARHHRDPAVRFQARRTAGIRRSGKARQGGARRNDCPGRT